MRHHKERWMPPSVAGVLAVMLGLAPMRVHAQQVLSQVLSYDTLYVQQLEHAHSAKFDPSVVVVDPQSKTAVVTLTNPSDAELTVDLALQFYTVKTDTAGRVISAVDTTPSADMPSLVSWVQGLPEHVTLKPKSTDTLTIRLAVTKSLPSGANAPGEYWAQLVATAPTIKETFPVVVRMMVSDPAGPKLVQQPANGNMTVPMVARTMLVYRPSGKVSSALTLGTPTAKVLPYGQIAVCAPVQRTGSAGVMGRARIWIKTQGHDSLVAVRNFDAPLGSPAELQPCFDVPIPDSLSGEVTATLALDAERSDVPKAIRGTFAEVRATAPVTLLPADAPAAAASNVPMVVAFEPAISAGPLAQQLRRTATAAAKAGKLTLVEIGAPWCGPCQIFARSLTDSLMIDALHDVQLVRINFNEWGQSFVNGVYKTPPALPMLFLVNADGTPSETFDVQRWQPLASQYGMLDARAMAPPLKEFVAEVRAKQPKS